MASCDRTVKVSHGEDTRRGKLNLPDDAAAVDVYSAIRSAVAGLFGTDEERLVLKYEDEEGDLCTLTEHTIEDLLTIAPKGALRLKLDLRDGGLAEGADEPGASIPDVPTSTADDQTCDGADSAVRQRLRNLFAKMPLGPLRMALAFVQGMDPAAMHAWLPKATHFMARGGPVDEQTHQTMDDLTELQQLEPAALKALVLSELSSQVEAKISNEAAHGHAQPPHPLEAMLGPFLAANQTQGNAQQNPLEQLMGAAKGCKGMGKLGMLRQVFAAKGKGKCSEGKGMGKCDGIFNPSGASPFDVLGQLFGGKGKGKSSDMSPEPGFETAQTPGPCSAETAAPSAERSAFDSSVDDLMNMGLVSDRQAARELLTQHGDVSSVVSALTED